MKSNQIGLRRNFFVQEKLLLQQITIEAEVVRGENEEEETKVIFFQVFLFVKHNMKANAMDIFMRKTTP